MLLNYPITCLCCRSCMKPDQCEQCQTEISDMLLRIKGVRRTTISIAMKVITVEFDKSAFREMVSALESAGIYLG